MNFDSFADQVHRLDRSHGVAWRAAHPWQTWVPASPGRRFRVGRNETAEDVVSVQVSPDRFRNTSSTPAGRSLANRVHSAGAAIPAAEEAGRTLVHALGGQVDQFVWRTGAWAATRHGPEPHLAGLELERSAPRRFSPFGQWLWAVAHTDSPAAKALVALLRTGMGVDAWHENGLSLFVPDAERPLMIGAANARTRAWRRREMQRFVQAVRPEEVRDLLDQGVSAEATLLTRVGLNAGRVRTSLEPHLEVLRLLLAAGARPEDVSGGSLYASLATQTTLVGQSLPVPIDTPVGGGFTSLHHACTRLWSAAIQNLLNAGADPHREDDRGWTALHHAAAHGRTRVIQELLDVGANPRALTHAGAWPADLMWPGTKTVLPRSKVWPATRGAIALALQLRSRHRAGPSRPTQTGAP